MAEEDGDLGDLAATATTIAGLLEQIGKLTELRDTTSDIRAQREATYEIAKLELELRGEEVSVEAMALENRKKSAEVWDQTFQNMLGVSDKWKSSNLGRLMEPGGLDGFIDSMRTTFTATNIAVGALTKAVEITGALIGASWLLAKTQDDALVAFNKSTGASRLYGQELLNLEASMYHHGVTMDDARESYASMVNNVKDLKNMSETSRRDLSETTAALSHLGVSVDTTTANFQFLTAAMGLSSSEANSFSREMLTLAQTTGMPPEEMAKGFQEAAPAMAKFGSQSTEMYKKLAVNARAANMDVSQLLGIVEKFDTFEGAAQSVGQLNAILGGPFLNSMEMVQTTDPVERMKLLSDAANQAGASFDDMGYYQRIALTEAMGLKDVSELALVMAGGFDETVPSIKQSQTELAAIAKQSQEFNTLSDEMSQLMRMFATSLLTWVVPAIKWVTQGIQDLNQWMGGWLMPILGLFVAALFAAVAVVAGLAALLPALASAAFLTGAGSTAATGGLSALATAAGAATPVIGAATGGLTAFTTAAGAATPVIAAATAGFGPFALAMLGIGAAFLLAGAGIYLALSGVTGLMSAIDADTVIQKVLALNSLSFALGSLVLSSALMPFVAGNLWQLIATLNAINGDNLIPVAEMFSSINSILDKDLEGLMKVEQTIAKVAASINSIDSSEKVFAVKQLIDSVNAATARPAAADSTTALAASPAAAASTTALAPSPAGALNRPIQISLNVGGREWLSVQTETLDKLLNQY
jgi:hypothetical protein